MKQFGEDGLAYAIMFIKTTKNVTDKYFSFYIIYILKLI